MIPSAMVYIDKEKKFRITNPGPLEDSLYTDGFSICPDNNIAHGSSTNFYFCGDVYDTYTYDKGGCIPFKIQAIRCPNLQRYVKAK